MLTKKKCRILLELLVVLQYAKVYLELQAFSMKKQNKKAASVQGKVIRLINGDELTKLMIKHNVGVQPKTTIEIKKIR